MLTSLQLWRNLKPLDLNQNLLGGFVLIPFFQVCFFILMYFDSFGEFLLHFRFRLKCFFQKHRKFSRYNVEVFKILENMRIDTIFCCFFGLLGKFWWISICCQNLLSDWKAKAESWRAELCLTKSRNLFLRNSINWLRFQPLSMICSKMWIFQLQIS